MVKELLLGLMEKSMLGIGNKEIALAKELIIGMIEISMLENF